MKGLNPIESQHMYRIYILYVVLCLLIVVWLLWLCLRIFQRRQVFSMYFTTTFQASFHIFHLELLWSSGRQWQIQKLSMWDVHGFSLYESKTARTSTFEATPNENNSNLAELHVQLLDERTSFLHYSFQISVFHAQLAAKSPWLFFHPAWPPKKNKYQRSTPWKLDEWLPRMIGFVKGTVDGRNPAPVGR